MLEALEPALEARVVQYWAEARRMASIFYLEAASAKQLQYASSAEWMAGRLKHPASSGVSVLFPIVAQRQQQYCIPAAMFVEIDAEGQCSVYRSMPLPWLQASVLAELATGSSLVLGSVSALDRVYQLHLPYPQRRLTDTVLSWAQQIAYLQQFLLAALGSAWRTSFTEAGYQLLPVWAYLPITRLSAVPALEFSPGRTYHWAQQLPSYVLAAIPKHKTPNMPMPAVYVDVVPDLQYFPYSIDEYFLQAYALQEEWLLEELEFRYYLASRANLGQLLLTAGLAVAASLPKQPIEYQLLPVAGRLNMYQHHVVNYLEAEAILCYLQQQRPQLILQKITVYASSFGQQQYLTQLLAPVALRINIKLLTAVGCDSSDLSIVSLVYPLQSLASLSMIQAQQRLVYIGALTKNRLLLVGDSAVLQQFCI
jgi:hypothetical protein